MTRAVEIAGESSRIADEEGVHASIEAKDAHAALRELERLYGDALYRYIRTMIGSDDAAHDVWQNTFLQTFRDLSTFTGRSSAKTWLYQIARHRCLDELRSARRRQKRFTLTAVAPVIPDSAPGADERIRDRERYATLEKCVQALAPEARAAVLLRYMEGFSYDEMAEICSEKAATLRARVSRAMPVLRRCIEGEDAE